MTVIKAGRKSGGRLPKGKIKTFEMASWAGAGADTLERVDPPAPSKPPSYRQEPARAPSIESDVKVPILQALFIGTGVSILAAIPVVVWEWPKPVLWPIAAFTLAAMLWWLYIVGELRRLMWKIEETFDRDINDDGEVGEPAPVDNYIPVYHGQRVDAVDVPQPPERAEGDRQVLLRPSTRTIRKQVLWDYLWTAFESGDWTRDGNSHGGGCRGKGLNTKEWADVRAFVLRWDGVWETTDRPTLEAFVRNTGWTGPNGTALNDLNGPADA